MRECIFALDAGGTTLKAGLFTADGRIITGTLISEPTDSACGSVESIRASYRNIADKAKLLAEKLGLHIIRVGMDTPGPFEFATGTFRMKHKYTTLYGVSVLPWFYEDFGNDIRVNIIHDSEAFIVGASAMLGRDDIKNYAGVMIGTGLGFAVMKDGKVLRNENGGPKFSIYARPYRDGIAEDVISGRGIVNEYNKIAKNKLMSGKAIGLLAESGDTTALAVYNGMAGSLCEIIHDILEENSAEALIMGGQISRSFEVFKDTLERGLNDIKSLKLICKAPDIDLAHLVGAALA